MEVNKVFTHNIQINKQNKLKEQAKTTTSPVEAKPLAPVNSGLYQAYNNISFKSRPYDGTNFRADLEKRAEQSQTKLKLSKK